MATRDDGLIARHQAAHKTVHPFRDRPLYDFSEGRYWRKSGFEPVVALTHDEMLANVLELEAWADRMAGS